MKQPDKDEIFFSKVYHSNFFDCQIPPGAFELTEKGTTLKTNLFTIQADNKNMEAELRLKKIVLFIEESVFHIL